MIFNFQNIKFSDDEWIHIIAKYLNGWTEIPLSLCSGYDVDKLKFYDGFLGTLLKQTESLMKEYPSEVNKEFVDSWKYQGKIYRVLHKCPKPNKNGKYKLPKVDYNRMLTHWTDDYTFEGLTYKFSTDCKYIILEADTKEHLAFDVNKFRKVYGYENPFTEKEREIIFPMYRENIKEYRMTINEFIKTKREAII